MLRFFLEWLEKGSVGRLEKIIFDPLYTPYHE